MLQLADIVLYGTTHVPVGKDQVQHLEFARDCVDSFNKIYGDVLVKPQILLCPLIMMVCGILANSNSAPAKKVMSLKEPHLKMSKSHADPRSRIQLNDSAEQVAEKIKSALTDSVRDISYDPENRPGVSNLLDIMSFLSPKGTLSSEFAQLYKNLSIRAFKDEVARSITGSLNDIQERYHNLLKSDNSKYLEDVAMEGSRKARARAAITLAQVRHSMGLS